MSWRQITLGEIADFSNGINFDKSAYTKGVCLVGVSDFGNRFYPDYDSLQEVKKEIVRNNDYLLTGDIVFVRSNGNKELVGRCMLIDNPPKDVTYSGFCIRARLKNFQEQDPVFWTYHFKSMSFRRAMSGTAVGANIQNLSQGRLAKYEATIPDIHTQKQIAGILLSYDRLIENNQRQIKLLEEAVQRLYREWFTGHNISDLSDTTLSEIVTFKRGNTITKAQTIEGSIPVVAGGLEPAYYHNKANTNAPVITVSGSGANAGFARMYFEDVFASDCSFADSRSTPYLFFVYCFLKENKSQLDALQKGSAQPHVYAKDINAMVMKSIPEQKLEQFCEIVKPYFELMGNLERQSKSAIEARDRLLPKLMSGEIEI